MTDDTRRQQKNGKLREHCHSLTIKWISADIIVNQNNDSATIVKWCQIHCQGRFSFEKTGWLPNGSRFKFYFKDPNDRLLFVLAWQ
jgi:hypothetical protein